MDHSVESTGPLAGSRPAASYFSCLPKKSNQKKGTPLRHPYGAVPRLSRTGGAAAQLALARRTKRASLRSSNSARLHPRRPGPAEVAQKGTKQSPSPLRGEG